MPDTPAEPRFLTTKEVAELLRVKERKIYDLAAEGAIPCTRATGKLLFPRAALEDWIARHGAAGAAATGTGTRPAVFLGSHDPLLEWAIRESRCGLATYLDGSLDGLDRLGRAEGIAAGLHLRDPGTRDWNRPAVAARFAGDPVVLVEWAWRERGLIVAPGNPRRLDGVAALAGCRVVPRQAEAGSQALLEQLLGDAGLAMARLEATPPARSETDAALAVREGKADAAFGLSALARQLRLDFVPVARERFDLLVWRRAWFDEPFQRLIAFTRTPPFADKVAELGGYDVAAQWTVHHNGPG